MITPPEHHVYFAVIHFGDDPNVITQIMGLPPTRAWVRGEPNGRGRHTHSRWTIQSRLPLSSEIEEHFEDVLSQLTGHEEAVRKVASRFPAHIALAAYSNGLHFQLPATTVNRIAALGLLIDFDLYYFDDRADEISR